MGIEKIVGTFVRTKSAKWAKEVGLDGERIYSKIATNGAKEGKVIKFGFPKASYVNNNGRYNPGLSRFSITENGTKAVYSTNNSSITKQLYNAKGEPVGGNYFGLSSDGKFINFSQKADKNNVITTDYLSYIGIDRAGKPTEHIALNNTQLPIWTSLKDALSLPIKK